MAAYHAQDLSLSLRGRLGEVEGTWHTLLPLCMSYTARTKDFPHLDGLLRSLGAVISSSICTSVALRSRAKVHDSPHDPPQADPASNLSLIAEHHLKSQSCARDARAQLPQSVIEAQYPKTWNGAEKTRPTKDTNTSMTGPYFLPIQVDTTPIQAVRFGLKFLREYCEKERLNHTIRVRLDKPE